MEGSDNESTSEIEDGEFIVEKIINHSFRNGKCYFLLKWKGYPDEDNSWEEETSLNCPDLLAEYITLNSERIDRDRDIYMQQQLEEDQRKREKKKRKVRKAVQKSIDGYTHKLERMNTSNRNNNNEKNLFQDEISNNSNAQHFPKPPITINGNQEMTNNQSSSAQIDAPTSTKISSADALSEQNKKYQFKTTKVDTTRLLSPSRIPQKSNRIAVLGIKNTVPKGELFIVATKGGKLEMVPKETLIRDSKSIYLNYLQEKVFAQFM